jgi:hypothetical protein
VGLAITRRSQIRSQLFLSLNQCRICVQFAQDAALNAIIDAQSRARGFIPPFSLINVQSSASDPQDRNQSIKMLREGETTQSRTLSAGGLRTQGKVIREFQQMLNPFRRDRF